MNGGESVSLPYHCPKLRGNFLRPPCAGKYAEALEKREKFPHLLLGPLEHCLACRGKDLVIREAPLVVMVAAPPGRPVIKEEKDVAGVVVFKDVAEAERVLGPGKLPDETGKTAPAPEVVPVDPAPPLSSGADSPPRCPRHPEQPQIACGPTGKRAGQFMGACKVCLAERKTGRKAKAAKGSMTPAVARDLNKRAAGGEARPTEPGAMKTLSPEAAATGREAIGRLKDNYFGPEKPSGPPGSYSLPEHPCPKHPKNERHTDKNGKLLPFCRECYAQQGKHNLIPGQGCKSGSLMLNFGQKHQELRDWLVSQAEEYERELDQEIFYRLKMARREAEVVG